MRLVVELDASILQGLVYFKLLLLGAGFRVVAMEGAHVIEESGCLAEFLAIAQLTDKVVAFGACVLLLAVWAETGFTADFALVLRLAM